MSIDQEPHLLRQVAESFGIDAQRYDRSRPAYPDELIQRVVAASPGTDFLDVGCGTGIGARQYRAAGVSVLGVDVDTRMADVARQTGIEVEIGKFEEWRFDWQRHYTRDEWLDHLATTGQLTVLDPQQLAPVLDAVGTAIDGIGGEFTMQYVTLATAATLNSLR